MRGGVIVRQGRAPEALLWMAGGVGIGLLAILETTLFYRASPMIGFAAPIALALGAAVLASPQLGACVGIAAVPLEIVHTQISPMEGVLLLTAGSILLRWAFGRLQLEIDPIFFVFGAALLWMAAGFGIARDEFIVIRTVLMWSAFALVALWVSNAKPEQMRQVLWAIVVAATLTAAIAILSGSAQEARAGATAVEGRAQGSFTHPNQLAFFLVMALPPALVLAVRSRGLPRLAAIGATGVLFTALLLTLTRGAIIGASFSLALMLVWAPFRRVAAVVLVALLVFAVANGDALSRSKELNLVGARLATVLDRNQATVNNGRLQIWSKVPRIVGDHPLFGLGSGNFSQYSLQYGLSEGGRAFEHAHNVALTVLVEQGIPGALLLALTLWLIFRTAATALTRREHPDFPYALAPIAGLAGLFVNSMTDYPPGSNPNMALLLIEIGLLVAATRHLRNATR
jgi:O-antigen ligase